MSTPQEDKERGYSVGKWHDRDNYTCLWEGCRYATVDHGMIERHVAAHVRTGKQNLSDDDAAPPSPVAEPMPVKIVADQDDD